MNNKIRNKNWETPPILERFKIVAEATLNHMESVKDLEDCWRLHKEHWLMGQRICDCAQSVKQCWNGTVSLNLIKNSDDGKSTDHLYGRVLMGMYLMSLPKDKWNITYIEKLIREKLVKYTLTTREENSGSKNSRQNLMYIDNPIKCYKDNGITLINVSNKERLEIQKKSDKRDINIINDILEDIKKNPDKRIWNGK